MARVPRIVYNDQFEPVCDRQAALAERDRYAQQERQMDRCAKINTRPGFGKIANMKVNRGQ